MLQKSGPFKSKINDFRFSNVFINNKCDKLLPSCTIIMQHRISDTSYFSQTSDIAKSQNGWFTANW